MSDTKHGLTFEEQWKQAKHDAVVNNGWEDFETFAFNERRTSVAVSIIDEAAAILASKIREEYQKEMFELNERANEKLSSKDQEIETLKGENEKLVAIISERISKNQTE